MNNENAIFNGLSFMKLGINLHYKNIEKIFSVTILNKQSLIERVYWFKSENLEALSDLTLMQKE